MRLQSDFHDYYDHAFDSRYASSPILDRRSNNGRHRREDHEELERVGFRVPRRGTVLQLSKAGVKAVVVYNEPNRHCGEGKRAVPTIVAETQDPEAYAMEMFPPQRPPTSFRLLLVGELAFWLRYRSLTDFWRSNVGEVDIEETDPPGVAEDIHALLRSGMALRLPLVAVDFVEWRELLWAVDLNTAPGLRGTPIQEKLRPQAVHGAIAARWQALNA